MRKPAAKAMYDGEAANPEETSTSGESGRLGGDVMDVEVHDDKVTAAEPATKKIASKAMKGRKNVKSGASSKVPSEQDMDSNVPMNGDSVDTHHEDKASEKPSGNGDGLLKSDEKEVETAKTGKKLTKAGKNVRGAKHEEQEVTASEGAEDLQPVKSGPRATRGAKNNVAKAKVDETPEQEVESGRGTSRALRSRKNAAIQQDRNTEGGSPEESAPPVTKPAKEKGRGRKNAKSKSVESEQEAATEDKLDHTMDKKSDREEEPVHLPPVQSKGSDDERDEEQQSSTDETGDVAPQKKGKKVAPRKQPKKAPAKKTGEEQNPSGGAAGSPRKRGARAKKTKHLSEEEVSTMDNEPDEEEVPMPQKKGKKQPSLKKQKAVKEAVESQSPSKSDENVDAVTTETEEKFPEGEPHEEEEHLDEQVAANQGSRKRGKKQEALSNKKQALSKEADEEVETAAGRRAGKRGVTKAPGKKETSPVLEDDEHEVENEEPENKMPKKKAPKGAATAAAPAVKKSPAKRGKKGATTKQSSDESGRSSGKGDEEAKKEEPAQKKTKMQSSQDTDEAVEVGTDAEEGRDDSSKPWNLKICSWNVNGIRAWVGKDGIGYIKSEEPDIITLQETKCADSKLPKEIKELQGYHSYFLSGDQDGYSGVGLLSKEMPIEVKYGIGTEEHDKEGRVITAEYEKFYLVATYVPNAGKKLVRLDYRMEWDKDFCAYLEKLQEKKPVVLCGDMNVAHQPIDLENPKTNKRNAGFTDEEREGFSTLLGKGFLDSFRHLYPEAKKAYTFWTYMMNARAKDVGWRLDYFVLSKALEANLVDSLIQKDVMGSDHCPIVLLLNL